MRALLFASLAKGKSSIFNYLKSPDTVAMVTSLTSLGIKIECQDEVMIVEGGSLKPATNVIDAGNSGQVLRFVGALCALLPNYTVITGDLSIRENRPVTPLLKGLRDLGALAESSRLNDKAPIIIKGPIKPGKVHISGEDSQPVSALLIAACFLEGQSEIHVTSPGEKPWIDLTLYWLKRLGAHVVNHDYQKYEVTGHLSYNGFEMTIPGDFSSSAFPIAAALVTGSELAINNIDMTDIQGDKKIITILEQMGASFEHGPQTLKVKKSKLKGIVIDANEIIDAVPILAVLGCYAEGTTEIKNCSVARLKESDRLACITKELQKMGAQIEEKPDALIIQKSVLKGAQLEAHHDHRIAMSLIVAALGATNESSLAGIECIAKSYPDFAEQMKKLGANL